MSGNPEPAGGQPEDGAGSSGPSAPHEQPDVTTAGLSEPPLGTGTDPGEGGPAPELATLLEAVLLVADQPVPAASLAQVVDQPEPAVEEALTRLAGEYEAQQRGFDLRQVAGGWRFYTRAECAPWVERYVRDGQQARLTQAALETLAVVAYRQPVTRARVSAVRGVNVDGVVRTLVSRGLLAEDGADPETGGTLYVTTPLLLQKLGLRTIEELPSLAPLLPELDELEQDSMST